MLVVNCGSAGQSVDGDPRPSYAIISVDEKSASGRIIRFKYDIDEIIKALKKHFFAQNTAEGFYRGEQKEILTMNKPPKANELELKLLLPGKVAETPIINLLRQNKHNVQKIDPLSNIGHLHGYQ